MAAGVGGFVALPLIHVLIEWVGWRASLLWLIALLGLGNFAIAAYILLELRRAPSLTEVFTRRKG